MIVMGIDPGIGSTGIALVSEEKGNLKLLSSYNLTTTPREIVALRLQVIYEKIIEILKKEKPDVCALETLFFKTNVTTAFSVGQARGVIQLACALNNIPIAEYNPTEVKVALTGYGRAEKGQIQRMVTQILKLKKNLTPDDVADAAALAITHCFSYKLKAISNVKAQMSNQIQSSKDEKSII